MTYTEAAALVEPMRDTLEDLAYSLMAEDMSPNDHDFEYYQERKFLELYNIQINQHMANKHLDVTAGPYIEFELPTVEPTLDLSDERLNSIKP